MAYVKQVWTDRQVEKPLTFNSMTNADGTITLSPAPGKITQAGTLVTADRMNHIENGIGSLDGSVSDLSNTVSTLSTQVNNSKLKGDFVVLTGTLNADNSTTISYPAGFNADNTAILNVAFHYKSDSSKWGMGSIFNSSSYVLGELPYRLTLGNDNINLQIRNIIVTGTNGDATVSVFPITSNFQYRIVLMKIS